MLFTLISRVFDGLPLAESTDDGKEYDSFKVQAKKIVKSLNESSPSRLSIETGDHLFHYLIDDNVCYLCLVHRRYPRKLAFCYLEDLRNDFKSTFGDEVLSATRPYAFVRFDMFMQKTKKLYADTRTQRNLQKLNEDLHDAQKVMTKNVLDVLGRLERIENVSSLSSNLSYESKRYYSSTRNLNRYAWLRKWAPVVIVLVVVLLFMYWFLR